MVMRLIGINLVAALLYMSLWFVAARKRRRLDTVDSAWGGGFALIAWVTVWQAASWRTAVIALLVTAWSARLTSHLARRTHQSGEDPRYVDMAKRWKGHFWLRAYLSVFLTQGLLVWLVAMPIMIAAGKPVSGLGWLTLVGGVVWLKGFIIEAIADRQLAAFRAKPGNKGKNMESGLWHYSRHPNYYGELLQWWGIGLIALQVQWGVAGLLGPLVLTVLIVFVSGIPLIEKRRADNPAYQAYKRRTSPLILWPPKES